MFAQSVVSFFMVLYLVFNSNRQTTSCDQLTSLGPSPLESSLPYSFSKLLARIIPLYVVSFVFPPFTCICRQRHFSALLGFLVLIIVVMKCFGQSV